jgi:hypothetical protein
MLQKPAYNVRELGMIGGVAVGDNRLHDAAGWCWALRYVLGHHMEWNELHGLMCWLEAVYLCRRVEGPNAEGFLDPINQPRLEE